VIYQRPLAYLLGIEGLALLRAFAGDHDRAFCEARIAEIRRLLDHPAFAGEGVEAHRVDAVDGYRVWSRTYDEPRNGAFDVEEPFVRAMLDALPPGRVLDAACGTGRYAEHLAGRGHAVIGVDRSPDMLALARGRVPGADFRLGDLGELPVADEEVDAVVCALALTHVADLAPVMAEFARVLRPGGHLVISDIHHERVLLGSVPRVRLADGSPALLTGYRHLTGDYLRAALAVGLQVRQCVEPRPEPGPARPPGAVDVGPWEDWPWSLREIDPEATRAAEDGSPVTVVWHFQLPGA
jgi:SAM-dependent methyltransferase